MDNQANSWQHWIPALEKELAIEMQKAPSPSEVHAKDHVLRVLRRCIRLGEKLGADLEVLVAAVYLHDLGRHYIDDKVHGALSAQKAEPVLERINFPKERRDPVLHAIRVHDVGATPEERTTLESKILYDADKIDTLGVVGVLRYIRHFYGKKPIDYMLDDIEARWEGLALPETRNLALQDYRYIKDYFARLKEELGEEGGGETDIMVISEDNTKDNRLQSPPRPAATIVLIQDNHKGLQAYLLKRNSKSSFFPGSYVFPGGVLEEDDRDLRFWRDHIEMDMEEVSRRFGGSNIAGEDALGYCVAGIRETFEEAGVLIARNGSLPLLEQANNIRISDGLQDLWFRHLISSSGWILNLASLSRWSHWITPKLMKYHFDTLFFVAIMPPGQSCLPDRRETEKGIWISPADALEANLKGTIPLSPPTIVTMHELLDYPDADSLKREWETRPWGDARYPRMIQSKGGPVILEPWDPQYDDINENMDSTAFGPLVLSSDEPFSRLYLHNGIWKPVRV